MSFCLKINTKLLLKMKFAFCMKREKKLKNHDDYIDYANKIMLNATTKILLRVDITKKR